MWMMLSITITQDSNQIVNFQKKSLRFRAGNSVFFIQWQNWYFWFLKTQE